MQLHAVGLKPMSILLVVQREAMAASHGSTGKDFNRRFMPTLQDVENVVKRFRQSNQLHSNDAMAVDQLIGRLRAEGSDTVLYYHKQQVDDQGDITQHFRLGICTTFGRAMLKAFHDLVFLDGVYGMNKYGYPQLNLVVRDEYSNGVPVAFCIADKEDADVVAEFMGAIAEVGDVQAIGGMHAHAQNKLAPLTAFF